MQEYLVGVLHIFNGVQLHYDSNVHRKVGCENDHFANMILEHGIRSKLKNLALLVRLSHFGETHLGSLYCQALLTSAKSSKSKNQLVHKKVKLNSHLLIFAKLAQ